MLKSPSRLNALLKTACALLAVATAAAATAAPPTEKLLVPICVPTHCGAVDELGTVVIPFGKVLLQTGDLRTMVVFRGPNGGFGGRNREGTVVIPAKYAALVPVTSTVLAALTPDDRWGLLSPDGRELAPFVYADHKRYDAQGLIEMRGEGRFHLFDLNGKRFDVESRQVMAFGASGEWVNVRPLDQNGEFLFNLRTAQRTPVFDSLIAGTDGHALVRNDKGLRSVIDAQGRLLFPFKTIDHVSAPRQGWIAFGVGEKRGYLDLKGNVAVPPTFSQVGAVGKKGALVQMQGAPQPLRMRMGGEVEAGYGVIDRKGAWLLPADLQSPVSMYSEDRQVVLGRAGRFGVFDLDTGAWTVPMNYGHIEFAGQLIIADSKAPGAAGSANTVSVFGRDGRVLQANRYASVEAETGVGTAYLHAKVAGNDKFALIDPQGREIIGPVLTDVGYTASGLILGGRELPSHAMAWETFYDMGGKLIVQLRTDACGQQQWVNAEQQPVWPLKLAKACKPRK